MSRCTPGKREKTENAKNAKVRKMRKKKNRNSVKNASKTEEKTRRQRRRRKEHAHTQSSEKKTKHMKNAKNTKAVKFCEGHPRQHVILEQLGLGAHWNPSAAGMAWWQAAIFPWAPFFLSAGSLTARGCSWSLLAFELPCVNTLPSDKIPLK